ncbi:MAG: hypothetical protein MUP41_10335, partial [Desulfobacterales bacterium]|nr:hypothetical protein [Desulfobacterales bacterium]
MQSLTLEAADLIANKSLEKGRALGFAPLAVVILDAGGMGSGLTHAIWINADDATVADLTIRNAGEHGVSIQGRDRPTLYNLHILDTGYQLVKVNPWDNGSEDGL